jgi:hypothetical protein
MRQLRGRRRLMLGLDYGTTNSSVSFAEIFPDSTLETTEVHVIKNFPNDPYTNLPIDGQYQPRSHQVSSDTWYPDQETYRDEFLGSTDIDVYDTQSIHTEPATQNPRKDVYHRVVPEGVKCLWGYQAQPITAYSRATNFYSKRNTPVKWAKLFLARHTHLGKAYPLETQKAFDSLKSQQVVQQELDFITDFLTGLLSHAKSELKRSHNLLDDEIVEVILCVPVVWKSKANRDMISALKAALCSINLRYETIFLITEAEAAANFVLHGNSGVRV